MLSSHCSSSSDDFDRRRCCTHAKQRHTQQSRHEQRATIGKSSGCEADVFVVDAKREAPVINSGGVSLTMGSCRPNDAPAPLNEALRGRLASSADSVLRRRMLLQTVPRLRKGTPCGGSSRRDPMRRPCVCAALARAAADDCSMPIVEWRRPVRLEDEAASERQLWPSLEEVEFSGGAGGRTRAACSIAAWGTGVRQMEQPVQRASLARASDPLRYSEALDMYALRLGEARDSKQARGSHRSMSPSTRIDGEMPLWYKIYQPRRSLCLSFGRRQPRETRGKLQCRVPSKGWPSCPRTCRLVAWPLHLACHGPIRCSRNAFRVGQARLQQSDWAKARSGCQTIPSLQTCQTPSSEAPRRRRRRFTNVND